MYFALVNYPNIKDAGFHLFRNKYDSYSTLMPEHITFIFAVPQDIGRKKIEHHIRGVLETWDPFDVHFCNIEKTWDHCMYLGAKEGHDAVVKLHDAFYEGILKPYLRQDLPFDPHIGLGFFSKEDYDLNNPTAELTLDEDKYEQALKECEAQKFDFWCTIDKLTLVEINADFTQVNDLDEYLL